HIQFVLQNSRTPVSRAIHGGGVPCATARGRHPLLIQAMGDLARRSAINVFAEDAANYFRLITDNDAFAAFARNGSVSVSEASSGQSSVHSTCLAPAHLMSVVFPIKLSDKTTKANQNRIDDAFMNSSDFDPKK